MDCLKGELKVVGKVLKKLKLKQENIKDSSLSLSGKVSQKSLCIIRLMTAALSLQTIHAFFAVAIRKWVINVAVVVFVDSYFSSMLGACNS